MTSTGAPRAGARAFSEVSADARATLAAWSSPLAGARGAQDDLRREFLHLLASGPDAIDRGGGPAHLTASCLVMDPTGGHVLLTHHRKAGAWFQFGGHVDATDESLWAAATREAREESGLTGLVPLPDPVHLDRHPLVGSFGPCREHLDVRYVAVADLLDVVTVSRESHDVRWWSVDDLPTRAAVELAELIEAARSAL